MQAVAQIMRQWCGIAALVLSPTLAWAACPALPSAVVPYTIFGGNGAAAVTTQATTTADATVQGAVAFDTAAGALKVCGGTSWQTLGAATPAGSSGYVQFSNGSAFGADSGLFWDNTNKRLGIGTTSPTNALDVTGAIRVTGNISQSGNDLNIYNSIRCKSDGTSGTDPAGYCDNLGRAIVHLAGDNLNLNYSNDFDGGVVIGTLNKFLPDGSLGVGTVTPAATLDVNGYMKLKKNTAAPVTCGGTYDGAIALTSARRMCVCDGTSWKEVNSATACTW